MAAGDLSFEWDSAKDETSTRKHGVSFEEASTAFGDPLSVTIPDPEHSEREVRFLLLGRSDAGRLLVVAHTERGQRIRIISARPAMRHERRDYEESDG
ncbi:MAG TPA: BrnT family toxin [Longimicrobium sp.]|nr:BrnT family toxin [Longimicrobium sp.]